GRPVRDSIKSTASTSEPRESWRGFCRPTGVSTEMTRSVGTTSALGAPLIRDSKIPSRWSGDQPCR
ncbi:MAG: hypothetical protein ACK55Z_07290, partial [bacterium]